MSDAYIPIPAGQDRSLDSRTVAWFCKGCPYLAITDSRRTQSNTIISSSGNVVQQADALNTPPTFTQTSMGHHEYLNTNYHCTSPAFTEAQAMTQDTSTIGGGYCPFVKSKLDIMYDSVSDEGGN